MVLGAEEGSSCKKTGFRRGFGPLIPVWRKWGLARNGY